VLTYTCPQCSQQLTLPAVQNSQAYRCPRCGRVSRPAALAEARPDRVAGYEVLEELGRGAMGVVYKARQARLGRLVALKMILDGTMASPEQRARFCTEAEAVARLNHPHIVHIHEIGEHDGRPFFSMEYIGGGSLAQRLNGTPMPPREAARLAEHLARAVQHAHQQGIVHRDLKPANILLANIKIDQLSGTLPLSSLSVASTQGGAEVRTHDHQTSAGPATAYLPKITDFGLAKKLDRTEGPTGTGAVLGTPSYMAPEQARGENKDIGPAADIWALGATLYELLTGRPPFRGATVVETLLQVSLDEPVPPRQCQPALPRDLETICLKCLAKNPRRRYSSAEALGDDLHRFLEGLPIQARLVGSVERMVKWARRRPAAAGLIALGLLLLVALPGASLGLAGYEYRQRLLTLPQPAQAELQAERVHTLALSPDHTRLAASLDKNQVQLFDARTGQALGPALQHPSGTPCLALGPDNKTLVTACYDRQVRVWDAESGKLVHPKPWSHGSEVDVVALSADGKLAVSGCRDGKAQVWDVTTGKAVGPALGCGGEVTAAAFSPDGKFLVLGDLAFQVRSWRVDDGQPRGRPIRLAGRPTALAVSRDGRRVLVGTTGDNVARLVDVETGQPVGPLLLHKDGVLKVAFSPDEQMVATGSASRDGTARLWDTVTGKALGPPIRHRGHVPAVAFSRDGTILWTAGTDRQVVRTELPTLRAGSPSRVYYETVLRAGMYLDQQNVEHVLRRSAWLQVQKQRDEADVPKQP